jgi:hypothetical protein
MVSAGGFVAYQFASDLRRGTEVAWAPGCSSTGAKFVCVLQSESGVWWLALPSALLLIVVWVASDFRDEDAGAMPTALAYLVAAAVVLLVLWMLITLFPVPGVFFLPSGYFAIRSARLLARRRPGEYLSGEVD